MNRTHNLNLKVQKCYVCFIRIMQLLLLNIAKKHRVSLQVVVGVSLPVIDEVSLPVIHFVDVRAVLAGIPLFCVNFVLVPFT